MTRTTSARLAGFAYLFYIAVAFPSFALMERAAGGEGIAAKLASIAAHASDVRLIILLSVLSCFAALVLAVGLYGITRDVDHELAVLALSCRVGEGIIGGASLFTTPGLLWLATATGANAPEAAGAQTLGAFLLKMEGWNVSVSATFFAVGSTIFCWLLVRGRLVPVPLAWLGVIASVPLVVILPLQLAGLIRIAMEMAIWLPMLVFEVVLGLWLLIKGVAPRATTR